MLAAPFRKEIRQALVDRVGKHDANRYEFIADDAARLVRDTLALQPERLTRAGPFRDRQAHAAGDGRNLDLSAQHRLIDGDRHLDENVFALPLELRVRPDLDLDESVARWSALETHRAFALQPEHLPVGHAFRHVEIENTALGERHALLRASDRFEKIDLEGIAKVLPLAGETSCASRESTPRGAGPAAPEDVDAIAGSPMGRPKSAAFGTADLVGLDTFVHVAKNCYDGLPDDEVCIGDRYRIGEAEFEVTQLPSGEVLDVKLRRSSGNPTLDAAVERAIRKSSPLPKPAQAELFERILRIPYKPHDD